MDPTLDANIASESSPEVEVQASDVTAESSPAETTASGEQAPKTLLDAVNEAIEEPKAETPAAEEKKDDAPAPELTEDQKDKLLPFNEHPRFKELITQKNEFRAKTEELTQTVEQFKPKVEQFDQITSYMEQNRLQPQEVQEGFKLMAMLKNNPAEFAKAISPYLQQAAQFTGDILPDDLKAEVDGGYMTQERARELASLRANSQFQTQNLQERLTAERQARKQDMLHRTVEANRTAVNNLEAQWKQADPDWDKKAPFVMNELRILTMDNPPRNPNEAVALAEKARASVEERLRGVMPQRKAVTPTPQGRAAGTTPTKKPTSLREVVDLALQG